MATQFINIDADLSGIEDALKGTAKSLKAIQKGALRIIAKGTVKAIRGAIAAIPWKKSTGALLKCYVYHLRKDGSSAVVTPNAKGNKGVFPKVYVLNYGMEGTKRRPHGFIQVGEKYAESGGYMKDIESYIDKELKKYWG